MTMNDEPDSIDRRLQRALHELRDADADLGAAPEVAARLRSAVGERRARERRRQMAWLATAAAIVLSVSAAHWYFTSTSMVDQPVRVEAPAPTDPGPSSQVPTDFLPLRYASVPASSGRIVQLVVPSSAMASFGLDPASAGGDAVNADVFVGDDGLARAIRFSPFSAKELVP
jgi:hypothetical protein